MSKHQFAQRAGVFLALTITAFQPCWSYVTVYHQHGWQAQLPASAAGSAAAPAYTVAAAYNPTELEAPPPPEGAAFPKNFRIALANGVPNGASIQQSGSFMGFSVEMSVADEVLGKNASLLHVPFLNLMANIQQRAGSVSIRVGGNTQEEAALVESTPNGRIIEKDFDRTSNPTQTPPLIYTSELIYMLRNISSLVNVRWHLGIPFNDTNNWRLDIVEQGQQILGDYLIGLQAGNEPDLYANHGHRPPNYSPYDYFGEFGDLVEAFTHDSLVSRPNLLIGPSVNTGPWTPEMVWNTGFVDSYSDHLAYLSVEHYPSDNCYEQYGIGTQRDAQEMFPTYLNHTAAQTALEPYLNTSAYAFSKGKKLLMFETNSASCGGFPGISDSFGAALWGLDFAMQMAFANFSGALFHVGGQDVSYNPFTPPPTNQSSFRQWTVGPIYYSALVMAEALGSTNTTQVLDMGANNNNIFSPAYAIYEHGILARVMLFNYVSDSSGNNDAYIDLDLTGTQVGSSVLVKYLSAQSVSQQGHFTWAGQTFGGVFSSDGRPSGTESINTNPCTNQVCRIRVSAPSAALVFLYRESMTAPQGGVPTKTFATTRRTMTHNTATVDPTVLATSNGHMGMGNTVGSTSEGSVRGSGTSHRPGVTHLGLAIMLSSAVPCWITGWMRSDV